MLIISEFVSDQSGPRLITIPKNQTVVAGRVATFSCAAIGHPKPQIEWKKNGKRVVTTRYNHIDIPNGSMLRIEPVRPVSLTIRFDVMSILFW